MSALDMGITAPCPFCGERDAPDVEHVEGTPDESWTVCVSCRAQGPVVTEEDEEFGPNCGVHDFEQTALKAWNERGRGEPPDDDAPGSLVPALEESLRKLAEEDPKVRQLSHKVDVAVLSLRKQTERLFDGLSPKEQEIIRKRFSMREKK